MIIGEYGKFVLVTYCGMVLALVAMFCFIHGQVANGMMCFIVSGICDLFDGKVANSFERTDYQKRYGVEIDSLCDMISFAALPAVLILTQLAFNGWSILLVAIYVLAAVTRLATFNADTKNSEKTAGFFIGVPVTYSALVFPLTYLATATWWSEGVQWILPIVALGMAYLFVMNRPVPKPRGKAYLFFCLLALGGLIALWRL